MFNYNMYNPYMPANQRTQNVEQQYPQYGQYNQYTPQPQQSYPQNPQSYPQPALGLQGKSVESLDVVKATEIPLDGSISYFPLTDGTAIITKQLQADGTSKIVIYKPDLEPIKPVEQPKYVTEEQVKEMIESSSDNLMDVQDDIQELRRELRNISEDMKELRKPKDTKRKGEE